MTTLLAPLRCIKHNGGTEPCLVLEHFATYEEALEWAVAASHHEQTRFLIRYDAGRAVYDPDGAWEAIQTWLRNM